MWWIIAQYGLYIAVITYYTYDWYERIRASLDKVAVINDKFSDL